MYWKCTIQVIQRTISCNIFKILHWLNNLRGFVQKWKHWYFGKMFSEWFWFRYEYKFSCASINNFNILWNWQGRALDGRTLSATWSSKHNQYPVVRTRPQYRESLSYAIFGPAENSHKPKYFGWFYFIIAIKWAPKTHKPNIRKVLKNRNNEICTNKIRIRRGSPVYMM